MAVDIGFKYLGNIKGAPGEKGAKGDPGTFAKASAKTVPADEPADVRMRGPQTAREVEFDIPRGLPSPDAVPSDEFVATVLGADDTETGQTYVRRTQEALVENRGWVAGSRALAGGVDGSMPVLTKPLDGPVLRAQDQDARSIYYPSLTDMRPFGIDECWMLYSTDHEFTHANSGVYLATAPHPLGPWTAKGLIFRDDVSGGQTETPSAIFRNPVTGALNFLYSQANVSGALGVQSSLIAKSLDNGATWQRHGVVLDKVNGTPGDGHTGYASVFTIGSTMYARSLYGGAGYGYNALWRAPLNPYDPWELLGYHGYWPDKVRRFSYAGDTPIPSASIDGNVAMQNLRAFFGGSVFASQGRLVQLFSAGPRTVGPEQSWRRIVAAPLRDDLMSPSEQAVDITPPAQGWEGDDLLGLGAPCSWDGRKYMPYRGGGASGGLGIMEVQ